ncbi:MAG TPA: hypothetical protein VKU00_02855, partial [Chthonomonadaceae bacterium]|nr:hypothetical protein [Chthonomonadaceae bacterium]
INSPPLLIADEPTGNLDPETSMGIVQLLQEINRQGTTVLVATHDAHVVDRMQKRVVAFMQGRLVRDDAQGAYLPGSAPLEPGLAVVHVIEEEPTCP